ncbi:Nucleoside-diphosphate-sugar epimerase [Amycolatopsis xylanica]|uniref:Nucleoside-diphosphate-sugar epimerase n=1 Tax=Amycolatopsis xylanica TaxID=589385 RepID=A0A1H3P6X9_9PSEU|nr:NAD(P)-dependent oxidoreductase [Amycolatopsis xylanica]SDY96821.1 Nucleoside-diphosphate-sugar epimerase [Amycolatopsis xylanica]
MKVFVTGGTGAIGGHVIPTLIAAGHEVSALARSPEKAAVLTGQGAKPVSVSIFDTKALTKAFAGHDAVVNLASSIPPMTKFLYASAWKDNDRIRTLGSAAVVDAALAAGAGRVIQESVSMLYRDHGPRWVDEDAPVDDYPMTQGNLAAEANAKRFTGAGGAGIVLRLGWFYGPGAAHSEQILAQARRRVGLVMGAPGGYVSSIHMTDAGSAVAAALTAPAGIYNVVDDEPLTKREFADALARAAGKRSWVRGPGRVALVLGDRVTSLTRSLRVRNTRFRTATGWRPEYPSAREGWIATAKQV